MSVPYCPSCRESMSSVELETPGFWSCLYCEGIWVPGSEVEALSARASLAPAKSEWVASPHEGAKDAPNFFCPSCGSSSFAHVTAKGVGAHCCSTCHGIYLPKGVLEILLPPRPASAESEAAAVAVAGQLLFTIVSAVLS